MKIEVKQSHIDEGVQGSCDACPIALAICEVIDPYHLAVNRSEISFSMKNNEQPKSFYFPDNVFRFVSEFDRGIFVEPFSFELPT